MRHSSDCPRATLIESSSQEMKASRVGGRGAVSCGAGISSASVRDTWRTPSHSRMRCAMPREHPHDDSVTKLLRDRYCLARSSLRFVSRGARVVVAIAEAGNHRAVQLAVTFWDLQDQHLEHRDRLRENSKTASVIGLLFQNSSEPNQLGRLRLSWRPAIRPSSAWRTAFGSAKRPDRCRMRV